jgi:hypothetical protein
MLMRGLDLLPLLRTFALRTRNASVDLRQFAATLQKGQAQAGELETAAAELAGTSLTIVETESGKPRIVSLTGFPLLALVDAYKQISVEPTRPFPREDTLPVPIPAETFIAADVKSQLGAIMETSAPGMKGIVKLQFPEGVDALVVAQESVGTDLVEGAVAKISRWLQDGKNSAYAESKLSGVLRGNEVLVRQSMEDVAIRPKKAASTVLTPTDFTFRFWTHLSNLVLQDMRSKTERTDQDQGILQSAYIIGYAVFHKKGAVQREREWSEDRKKLEAQVRKPPFVFGFQELYDLKDEKGSTFVQKHSRDFINSFLKEKTVRTGEETIPFLVRLHAAAEKKDYFIQRDMLVPVFLRKLAEASEELRKGYLDEWTELLRRDDYPAAAKTNAAFRRDVEIRVKEGYPLLTAMSNGSFLFLAGEDTRISGQVKAELARCFAVESILRPCDELLVLERLELLKNARMYLPFWMTVPVLSGILRVFRRMFKGRGAGADDDEMPAAAPPKAAQPEAAKVVQGESGAPAPKAVNRENLLRYKRSIQSLVSTYVPQGSTIDATLGQLAEKWNPLYAAAQKKNLVEDVNALVRDFLRPVRRSFLVRPPDLKRIHALAEQLSESKALAKIKKRDILMRYIELYMIRCLQVKQI